MKWLCENPLFVGYCPKTSSNLVVTVCREYKKKNILKIFQVCTNFNLKEISIIQIRVVINSNKITFSFRRGSNLHFCLITYIENNEILTADEYSVRDQISVGEWCIFSREEYELKFPQSEDEGLNVNLLFGMVLGLTYIEGQTFKQREYSKTYATVHPETKPETNPQRSVGVLCSLYTCDLNGLLTNVAEDKHKFIKIESYVGTIKPPIYANKLLTISTRLVELLVEK